MLLDGIVAAVEGEKPLFSPPTPNRRRATLAIFAAVTFVTIHAALLFIYWVPSAKTLAGDEQTYARMAQELAAGAQADADYLRPPLYAWFLSLTYRLSGGSPWLAQAVQTLLLVAVAGLVRDLTRRFTGSLLGGDLAGLLVLVYPPLVAYAHFLWPEVLHLALFLAALWIVVARGERLGWMPLLGLALGLALLTKSVLGPFSPAFLLPLALRGTPWGRLLRPVVVALVVLAVLAPTLLAHRRETGRAMIADSSWFNLWVGLNDTSRKSLGDGVVEREYLAYQASAPSFAERNEILKHKIRELVRTEGPLRILRRQLGRQYFRLFEKDSYLTEQLPGGALAAIGQGYRAPPRWLALALHGVSYSLYALVLAAAAAGVVMLSPRRCPWLLWVLAFFAYNLAIFLFLHVKSRYQVPMLPFFFLYAGALAGRWLERGSLEEGLPIWRRGLAAVSAGAMLFLAFGAPWLD